MAVLRGVPVLGGLAAREELEASEGQAGERQAGEVVML